jgi:myo-inositol-1-phosphate synthase
MHLFELSLQRVVIRVVVIRDHIQVDEIWIAAHGGRRHIAAQQIEPVVANIGQLDMVWCGSTEVFHRPGAVHQSLRDFECGLMKNDPDIAPSQIYAYAALKSGVPYANGAPNLTTDTPALLELARERQIPVCGKDFKTGQTFMKTLIAPVSKPACSA